MVMLRRPRVGAEAPEGEVVLLIYKEVSECSKINIPGSVPWG